MPKSDTSEILAEVVDMLTDGNFSVSTSNSGNAIVHQINIDRSEYGKVCGSKGKMIRAIKHIWEICISRSQEVPIRVTLMEPTDGYAQGRSADVPSENFDPDDFGELMEDVISLACKSKISYSEMNKSFCYNVCIEEPPHYISSDFYDSVNVLFHAMAKANGGKVEFKFNG